MVPKVSKRVKVIKTRSDLLSPMEAKVAEEIEDILKSKGSRGGGGGGTPRIPKEGLLDDDDDDDEPTSSSPRIPKKGLLQSEDDEDSEVDSDDELDEDEDITLEEIVSWVTETQDRIIELEDKLHRTGDTKSGVKRVLDELAKQYGLLEDMQVDELMYCVIF